jgi:hypothetical protein
VTAWLGPRRACGSNSMAKPICGATLHWRSSSDDGLGYGGQGSHCMGPIIFTETNGSWCAVKRALSMVFWHSGRWSYPSGLCYRVCGTRLFSVAGCGDGRAGGPQLYSSHIEVLWWWQYNPAREMYCSKVWWKGTKVAQQSRWKSCSEPVLTRLASVVSLHGGISEECQHFLHPLRVISPGENISGCPVNDGSVFDIVSLFDASALETLT